MEIAHHEIVKKLVGEINPIGESNTDSERLENLKIMCDLVYALTEDISSIINNSKNHWEHSIKNASEYAINFFKVMKELVDQ